MNDKIALVHFAAIYHTMRCLGLGAGSSEDCTNSRNNFLAAVRRPGTFLGHEGTTCCSMVSRMA